MPTTLLRNSLALLAAVVAATATMLVLATRLEAPATAIATICLLSGIAAGSMAATAVFAFLEMRRETLCDRMATHLSSTLPPQPIPVGAGGACT